MGPDLGIPLKIVQLCNKSSARTAETLNNFH